MQPLLFGKSFSELQITAIAASFGTLFWFEVRRKLANPCFAGAKPDGR